jgi:hypothetical protein
MDSEPNPNVSQSGKREYSKPQFRAYGGIESVTRGLGNSTNVDSAGGKGHNKTT